MSNHLRGAIRNAVLVSNSSIYGILNSTDLCAGEAGRNALIQGREILTSTVVSLAVEGGMLIANTLNSKYIIDGELVVERPATQESLSKSVGG